MPLNLEHLEKLVAEWKSLQPLQAPLEERLWQKLRLLWNYHSNHIEGNTLTYGETELLLLHGRVSGAHDLREYEEMKSHDVAIAHLRTLAQAKEELTEVDVRELNQILLKEPFFKNAMTATGVPTRKEIVPGRYKVEANSTRTATGDIFEFVLPGDVPVRMPQLIQAIRASIGKEGLELIASLAFTHHEFVYIHPFDDGNGRTARLLTNYVLLKKGLPPLVVPTERRKDYLHALDLANGGDMTALSDFLAEQLIWALELGVKAAKGESLEEPSDVEKRIALFVTEQKSQRKDVLKKDMEVTHQFIKTSLSLLFGKFDEKTKKIGELFESRSLRLFSDVNTRGNTWQICLDSMVADRFVPNQVSLNLSLKGYIAKALHPFGMDQLITVSLNEYEYTIVSYGNQVHHAVYAEALTAEKADEIISDFLTKLFQQIKQQAQQ